ncbi:hypothetical protein L210DRAFT_522095 [Boletus edulis BED1]|uniref:Uncharacterized protein n=1 Tax=Boletus edulis BED1 TaxID=1328754 RepID=A0AAD4BY68_BOLED|nr:hypothetical protein L210DRAFT_522095 [Boletus edulis BED1]
MVKLARDELDMVHAESHNHREAVDLRIATGTRGLRTNRPCCTVRRTPGCRITQQRDDGNGAAAELLRGMTEKNGTLALVHPPSTSTSSSDKVSSLRMTSSGLGENKNLMVGLIVANSSLVQHGDPVVVVPQTQIGPHSFRHRAPCQHQRQRQR